MAVAAFSTVSAWGKVQAGEASAGAFMDSARAKEIRADSIMDRFGINSEFDRLEGQSFQGKQLGALSVSNIDVGSGLALAVLEDTAVKIERRIEINRMEAEANRDALLMDADLDRDRAGDARQSGVLGALGSVAQGFMMGS